MKRKLLYCSMLFLGMGYLGNAQSGFSSKSDFSIHNNANGEGVIVHKTYELNGVVKTANKSNSNKLVFDKGSTWNQVAPNSYVDGYVKTNIVEDFVFPTGNKGVYRPLGLSKSENSAVVFLKDTLQKDVVMKDLEVEAISSDGYWKVSSLNNSKITLTFDASSVMTGTNLASEDVNRLTIVAWNGSGWSLIPSKIDESSMGTKKSSLQFNGESLVQSVSSTSEVALSNYSAFGIGMLTNEAYKEMEFLALKKSGNLNYNLLKSIHFPFNEDNITVYSTRILNRILSQVKNTNAHIKLVGHTDFYGSNDYNYELGMKRAESIKAFLVANGVVNVEIELQSEGESNPKVDCEGCSSKEMVLNRRVDIYVLN